MPKNLRQIHIQQIKEFLVHYLDFSWDELDGMTRGELTSLLDKEDKESLLIYATNPNPTYA